MIPVGKPHKSARHDSRVNFADLGGKNQRIQFEFSHPNSEDSEDGNIEFSLRQNILSPFDHASYSVLPNHLNALVVVVKETAKNPITFS